MKTVTTHHAKTHLSRLLKEVQAGQTIVILNGTVPAAKLTAVHPSEAARPPAGTLTSGEVHYTDDAFKSLTVEEMKDWGI